MKRQYVSRSLFAVLLSAAAMLGVAIAGPFEDGLAAAQKGDYTTALRLWRRLADRGDADAQYNLGVMHNNGDGSGTALAVKKLTSTIPIVFVNGTDPVKAGLLQSISRPEANVTGVNFLASEIVAKRLEFLLAFVPNAKFIAILVNPRNPQFSSMTQDAEVAERTLKISLQTYQASTEGEIDSVLSHLQTNHPDALLIGGDAFFVAQSQKIAAFSLRQSLPAIFDTREFPADGGLMSYGASQTSAYRQAGEYVGRIIGGAKPGELPVLQSTRFELVINRATAKALKLQIPDKLNALADEVIE